MTVFDLYAYLGRIGFRGEPAPTLETLQKLHLLHPQAIPFESLDVALERPILLELGAISQKLIHDGRGGYCFEQNLLLAAALRAIGFDVRQLAARVQWNDESDRINARTHMLLQVLCEGQPYFVDVGFGGIQQTTPLRPVIGLEQPTSHEPFRLMALADGDLQLQARIQDSWRALYRFDLQEQHLVDYELANYWVSTNPNSRFVKGLIAARVTPDGRYALHNNALATHPLHGATERRLITDALDLRVTLESVFQIRLPTTPQLDALLERLVRMT